MGARPARAGAPPRPARLGAWRIWRSWWCAMPRAGALGWRRITTRRTGSGSFWPKRTRSSRPGSHTSKPSKRRSATAGSTASSAAATRTPTAQRFGRRRPRSAWSKRNLGIGRAVARRGSHASGRDRRAGARAGRRPRQSRVRRLCQHRGASRSQGRSDRRAESGEDVRAAEPPEPLRDPLPDRHRQASRDASATNQRSSSRCSPAARPSTRRNAPSQGTPAAHQCWPRCSPAVGLGGLLALQADPVASGCFLRAECSRNHRHTADGADRRALVVHARSIAG